MGARQCLIILVGFLVVGCVGATNEIVLPTQTFVTIHTSHGPKVVLLDPQALFEDASRALKERKYWLAVPMYRLLVKHFPDHDLSVPGMYNLGLALLRLHRYDEAVTMFSKYLKYKTISKQDKCDALENIGIALAGTAKTRAVKDVVEQVIGQCKPEVFREIKFFASLATAYTYARDPANAIHFGRKTMAIYTRNISLPGMKGNYYAGMAAFAIGEAYRGLFEGIKLFLPTERMEKDLMDKAQYFLSAQAAYFRTIRIRNAYFAVKAGLAIGRLYEQFYNDLLAAEVPSEFNEEQRKVYFEILKKKIRPLIQKAVIAYQQNLEMGRRWGIPREWLEDASRRLARLKSLLEEDK